MNPALCNAEFDSLCDTDTVADVARHMLHRRVSDLPVVDADGKLLGMFKLDRLLAGLLPAAVLVGYGVPDLNFLSHNTIAELRARMREIDCRPVREFVVVSDQVVTPDTPPLEIVLLLYRGANNVPVVDPGTGRLVGMVSARDVLAALQEEESQ